MNERCIHWAEWLTDKYICLMLLVFPLFTGLRGYADITRSKYLFFVLVTVGWLLMAVLCRLAARRRIRPKPEQYIALAFALWACISAAASPYGKDCLVGASRYDGLATTLLYTGIFLGVSEFGKWRRRYVYLTALSVLGCAAVSLMQAWGSSVLFPNGYNYYDAGVMYVSKFMGTIGNTNLLAAFLCLTAALCASAAVYGYANGSVLGTAAFLGAVLLSFTESSGGMLALCAGWAVFTPCMAQDGVLPGALAMASLMAAGLAFGAVMGGSMRAAAVAAALCAILLAAAFVFRSRIPREKHSRAVTAALVICAVLGLLCVYFWPGQDGAVYELSQLLRGNLNDSFGSSRIRIWRETLRLVPEWLVFGGGPDTLALRLDLQFSRYFPELGKTLTTFADNAHNVYLGYLVNLGLPGLCLYLALMAVTLRRIFRLGGEKQGILGAALLCAWIENFFGLGLCLVAPVMWVLWALVFSEHSIPMTTGVEQDEKADKADDTLYAACDNGDILYDDGQAQTQSGHFGADNGAFPGSGGHTGSNAVGQSEHGGTHRKYY